MNWMDRLIREIQNQPPRQSKPIPLRGDLPVKVVRKIEMGDCGMKVLEFEALADAAERPDGWALFKRKTTAKLVARGWFEPRDASGLRRLLQDHQGGS